MRSPRQLFCDDRVLASAALDAIASTPVERAMAAAFGQVAWALGNDPAAHAKLEGARLFMQALTTIGVPPSTTPRPTAGFLDVPDAPGVGARKGA